jgi:hypothetical protein
MYYCRHDVVYYRRHDVVYYRRHDVGYYRRHDVVYSIRIPKVSFINKALVAQVLRFRPSLSLDFDR